MRREPVRSTARLTDVMRKSALGAGIAVAALLLAGCGDDTDSPSDGGTSSSPSESPTGDRPTAIPPTVEPTTPTEPSTTAPATPSTTAPVTPGATELLGVPEPGVEDGCWLLDDYLLLGGDEQLLSSGQPLRVTGRIERGVATTCQQGTPFRVDDIVPAE